MQSQKLDLVEICRITLAKKWFILIFAICAAVVGLIFCFVVQKEYSSKTVFIVKSPMNMDRNHLFRQGQYQNKMFFATEDQIDNVMTISKNESLLHFLTDSFNLEKHYGVKSKREAFEILKRRFKVTREDTRSVEFRVSDPDPKMASQLVNAARIEAEDIYRNLFIQTKKAFIISLQQDAARINKQIQTTNDSILKIRNQYYLYDILLPARGNSFHAAVPNINANKAAGIGPLQTATYQKDQLLQRLETDKSLISEYRTTMFDKDINLFYPVETGAISSAPSFPKTYLILLICFVAGLFFSEILVLLQASLSQHLNSDKSE